MRHMLIVTLANPHCPSCHTTLVPMQTQMRLQASTQHSCIVVASQWHSCKHGLGYQMHAAMTLIMTATLTSTLQPASTAPFFAMSASTTTSHELIIGNARMNDILTSAYHQPDIALDGSESLSWPLHSACWQAIQNPKLAVEEQA